MNRRLKEDEWRDMEEREARDRRERRLREREREYSRGREAPVRLRSGFAGPGGYSAPLEHSDYGFQGSTGAWGDYGGADRFTGDWRDRSDPWIPGRNEESRDSSTSGPPMGRQTESPIGRQSGIEEDRWTGRADDRWSRGRETTGPGSTWVYAERWTLTGPYAGRGPRGYRRSDERIQEEICEMLSRNSNIDASDVEVRVKDGVVELHGNVNNRHEKYLAEDLAESITGVNEVLTRLHVRKSSRSESYEKKLREET